MLSYRLFTFFIIQIIVKFNKMLTEHQQEKLKESLDILMKGNRLLITGSAGVGKTYMVNTLVKELMKLIPRNVYCSAPTNKAVSVLQSKVDKYYKLSFITTHAALKMKRRINSKNGEVSFSPYYSEKYPPLKGIGLFIIDEASMLNSELLRYIEEFADKFFVKVVFIGDIKQLNPVGESVSPVFTQGYPEVELLEIVRQSKGNPIITLSRDLPSIRRKRNNKIGETGYVYSEDLRKIINNLAVVNGTSDLKYLAWTNKEVNNINSLVRRAIYGENPNKVEEGETLIFNIPYKQDYFTNEEILVENFKIEKRLFPYPAPPDDSLELNHQTKMVELKCYVIKPEKKQEVIIIHEDDEIKKKEIAKLIKDNIFSYFISWKHYFTFNEQFADVKYNHALTVHKSQGSTYKQVIVNIGNINRNRKRTEREKMIYTAITRASDLLILYKV